MLSIVGNIQPPLERATTSDGVEHEDVVVEDVNMDDLNENCDRDLRLRIPVAPKLIRRR